MAQWFDRLGSDSPADEGGRKPSHPRKRNKRGRRRECGLIRPIQSGPARNNHRVILIQPNLKRKLFISIICELLKFRLWIFQINPFSGQTGPIVERLGPSTLLVWRCPRLAPLYLKSVHIWLPSSFYKPRDNDVKWGGLDRFKMGYEPYVLVAVWSTKSNGPAGSSSWFQKLPDCLITIAKRAKL